jgi:hypothetical protein
MNVPFLSVSFGGSTSNSGVESTEHVFVYQRPLQLAELVSREHMEDISPGTLHQPHIERDRHSTKVDKLL